MKYPEIARRFSYILSRENLRAQDLANQTGISKSAISLYVNGERCPTNNTALALGSVLNVNPLWLMGFDVQIYDDPITKPEEVLYPDEAEMVEILRAIPSENRERLLEYARLYK